MRRAAALALLALLAAGCTRTVLVPTPPRMDLARYGTLGIVQFDTDGGPALDERATREFQARLHAAQPGTPVLELGSRAKLLEAVGARSLDAEALRRIGAQYRVNAVFLGGIDFTETTDIRVGDIRRLEGDARTVLRGDATARLVETAAGANVWSSSAWATRQVGGVSVSVERGVTGQMRTARARDDLVPTLVYHLTQDFRPGTTRERVD